MRGAAAQTPRATDGAGGVQRLVLERPLPSPSMGEGSGVRVLALRFGESLKRRD
jgi:hypothetical protein